MDLEESSGPFGALTAETTLFDTKCGWCGTLYVDRGADGTLPPTTKPMRISKFGSLQVADCCFKQLEAAVLEHINDIVPWLARIAEEKRRCALRQNPERSGILPQIGRE